MKAWLCPNKGTWSQFVYFITIYFIPISVSTHLNHHQGKTNTTGTMHGNSIIQPHNRVQLLQAKCIAARFTYTVLTY